MELSTGAVNQAGEPGRQPSGGPRRGAARSRSSSRPSRAASPPWSTSSGWPAPPPRACCRRSSATSWSSATAPEASAPGSVFATFAVRHDRLGDLADLARPGDGAPGPADRRDDQPGRARRRGDPAGLPGRRPARPRRDELAGRRRPGALLGRRQAVLRLRLDADADRPAPPSYAAHGHHGAGRSPPSSRQVRRTGLGQRLRGARARAGRRGRTGLGRPWCGRRRPVRLRTGPAGRPRRRRRHRRHPGHRGRPTVPAARPRPGRPDTRGAAAPSPLDSTARQPQTGPRQRRAGKAGAA